MSVKKSDELAEARRSHVIVDGVEISVVGDVDGISAEPEMMILAVGSLKKRYAEGSIGFEIQREEDGEALAVWSTDILLCDFYG